MDPGSGSPAMAITLVFTQHTHVCFVFKDLRPALFKSFQVLMGFRAFQDCCPVPYRHSSKHLYQSSFSWEKTKVPNPANCVPTPIGTLTGPYTFKSSTRNKWSHQEVKCKCWTVSTYKNQSVKMLVTGHWTELRLGSWPDYRLELETTKMRNKAQWHGRLTFTARL